MPTFVLFVIRWSPLSKGGPPMKDTTKLKDYLV